MNIDWIIPCRYAEVHDNLATIVGAGIDTWWIPAFPSPVQVGVVVRLLATAEELGPGHEHTARNIMRGPDGGTLSDLQQPFQAGSAQEAEGARREWLNGVVLVTLVVFEATEPGTYSFEHIVDGSSKSVPLHVIHGLPGEAPPTG